MINNIPNLGLTGIIPFTYFGGLDKAVGSTTLRVENLVKSVEDFKIWKHGHKYDNLIFQKVYWKEMMEIFKGPKILDLCDPDWLTGEIDFIEMGNLVDAITCSSESLTKLVQSYFPHKIVVTVPDRLNFDLYPTSRNRHVGKAKKVAWFGFIHNAHETLHSMADMIIKYDLKLTIIADFPYSNQDKIQELGITFIKYDPETINSLLMQNDIILNPISKKAQFKYKSNNKNIIGWKLGVPVANNSNDIEKYIDANHRNREVLEKKELVNLNYDIRISANQYRDIIGKILASV